MLKVLLYAYVSLLALTCYSQETIPDSTGSFPSAIEDSAKNIKDIIVTNLESGKLQLSWQVASRIPDFFSVERSENGNTFEVVTVLNKLGTQKSYQWLDEAPKNGRSFYRLRYAYKQGESLYSRTVPAFNTGSISYKFYPNPVEHILFVKSDSPLDVQITDANGRVRMSHNRIQGIYTINVSSLEKGIYLIRFSNKLTNIMSQEKLIKN